MLRKFVGLEGITKACTSSTVDQMKGTRSESVDLTEITYYAKEIERKPSAQ